MRTSQQLVEHHVILLANLGFSLLKRGLQNRLEVAVRELLLLDWDALFSDGCRNGVNNQGVWNSKSKPDNESDVMPSQKRHSLI